MSRRNNEKYRNPCLTMHQPWASLLVHGIKRIEGRSWPAPLRGRLWIHAASKVPDVATITAMEDFYRQIYAVTGITDLQFPEHYPISRLIGCVEVVGCLRCEELACWKEVPEGVRLEGLTDFCWLCEQPQKLLVPLEMRGYHSVYNLEEKIYDAAVRGLVPVRSPQEVNFPLPDPRNPFSLKPGSISTKSREAEVEKSSSLSAAIAGARAAATQFSKKDQNFQIRIVNSRNIARHSGSSKPKPSKIKYIEADNMSTDKAGILACPNLEQRGCSENKGNSSSHRQFPGAELSNHPGPPFKIFSAAVRRLKPA